MYPGVELRLLRYVVVIAEELHFSRAAAKLHVSQPSLSKQIRGLEEELGISLFDRTKREVRLTRAGTAFVQEAREALLHSQRAVHVARAVHHPATFTLGYSPFVNLMLVSRVRAIPAADLAGTRMKLVSAFTGSQLEHLRAGELEAGLVVLPVTSRELLVQPVWSEPLQAVLPANHPLAHARRLRLRDLQPVPFISIGRRLHPMWHTCLMNTCGEHGLTPKSVQEVTTFTEAVGMVAEGLGFAFARHWPDRMSCPGVVFKAIEGNPLYVETGMAYGHAASADVIEKLIDVLTDACSGHGVASPYGEQQQAGA